MKTERKRHQRESIIQKYIAGYNSFDIDTMLMDFHPEIEFQNISAGQSNLKLSGLKDFRRQAEESKNLFSNRTQSILSFKHDEDSVEVEIAYNATLAVDLPNGLKKGNAINLNGKSMFRFKGNKIIELTDIS